MMFGKLYDMVLAWSRHRHAPYYLCGVSAMESSFFPVPTAFMLAPMCLANRERAWWYATITTISSVVGGVIGYLIGMFFFEAVGQQIIDFYDAGEKFDTAVAWFSEYGVWVVFIAGFSPIPYKLFTITSGMLGLALVPFILASLVGRAGQFFLVAGLLVLGGDRLEGSIRRYVEWLGWGVVVLAVIAYLVLAN
jgi:membrane protein YqaA with SNARE-associated domain